MTNTLRRAPLIAGLASLLFAMPLLAQDAGEAAHASSAEATVRVLYDIISSEAGRVPDWEPVRALFLPEALVILRSSREAMPIPLSSISICTRPSGVSRRPICTSPGSCE